jgi:hypothetical protein
MNFKTTAKPPKTAPTAKSTTEKTGFFLKVSRKQIQCTTSHVLASFDSSGVMFFSPSYFYGTGVIPANNPPTYALMMVVPPGASVVTLPVIPSAGFSTIDQGTGVRNVTLPETLKFPVTAEFP